MNDKKKSIIIIITIVMKNLLRMVWKIFPTVFFDVVFHHFCCIFFGKQNSNQTQTQISENQNNDSTQLAD